MALAGGLFAGPYVAGDSGASGYFYAGGARLVGAVDDTIFLSRWAARIPCMDDAGIVVRIWHRLGALPCVDSTAVEHLTPDAIATPVGTKAPKKAFNQGLLPSR
jgi:hypothetical protein